MAERQRNNVRAGIFMLVSIALAMFVIISLTDIIDTIRRPMTEYRVTFEVVAGVANLSPGSVVRVGGVQMGEVMAVTPLVESGGPLELIEVTFELDSSIELFADAKIVVGSALIGSEAWLEIYDVGRTGTAEGIALTGVSATGMLGAILGPDSDEMLTDARTFIDFLGDVPEKYETDVQPTLENVREIVADARDEKWPRWSKTVDDVMAWADGVTEDLDAAIAAGRETLETSRDILNEKRPKIDTIVDNVESGTDRFDELGRRLNEETVQKVEDLIDHGDEGLDEAIVMISRLQQDYEHWANDLGEVMGNASLASQQLKLTTAEIRRSPWKILYRPSVDELDHELLYEAARSFALAATDLKGASESVRRILDNHAARIDQAAFTRLEQNLTSSLQNYERAQQELFEVLVVESAP